MFKNKKDRLTEQEEQNFKKTITDEIPGKMAEKFEKMKNKK